ncbi:hypothetical protein TSUD_391910 [Trifolium subterraneum]|uniref:Uncharacterized protein n=1 Tax=Trifolium subterraneum TaxID=3900 RepID=A0A2Z6MZ31_TRISU|nr:hypothetical protein TSUD_391910 [Trifolium subterraneum]
MASLLIFQQPESSLNHPHLQPYILKVHLKLNSPRSTFPFQWPESNYAKRTRFVEPQSVSTLSDQDRYLSLNNHRALNPKEKIYDLSSGVVRDHCNANKSKAMKSSTGERTPRLRVAKESASDRRQTTAPPKICYWNTTNFYTDAGYVDSPDVFVDAPQIDRIAEFAMASYEDPFFHVIQISISQMFFWHNIAQPQRTSVQSWWTKRLLSPSTQLKLALVFHLQKASSSECSNYVTACVSSRSSSELREHRFDTSSYQQRADALEGLPEFSARLQQQHRFDVLGVLLKPFGPEKVSPRETTIWLAKSFKQNYDLRFPHTLT